MFSLLKSITELATDVVKVVAAPIEAAVDLADAVVKPLADAAQEVAKDIKDSVK